MRQQERRPISTEKHRVDGRIRAPEVIVIDESGTNLGVLQTFRAQSLAKEKGLNLVEVNPQSRPPVCKVMDYGKFKYEEKKSQVHKKEQRLKEITLHPGTDDHDVDFKVRHIIDFLMGGDKVKISIRFRGRAIVHPEEGRSMLLRIIGQPSIKSISKIDSAPFMEGRSMYTVISPVLQRNQHTRSSLHPQHPNLTTTTLVQQVKTTLDRSSLVESSEMVKT